MSNIIALVSESVATVWLSPNQRAGRMGAKILLETFKVAVSFCCSACYSSVAVVCSVKILSDLK